MEAINKVMIDSVKYGFSTPETTLQAIEAGKDPKKFIEANKDIDINPTKLLVVSEVPVTKGSVIEALNKADDLSVKGLEKAENIEGKEPNVIPSDVLNAEKNVPNLVYV